jgi:hypothetical protein
MKDFGGLELEGHIPVRQEILNEVIATGLTQGIEPPTKKIPKAEVDVNALLPHFKRVEITAEDGKITLDFAIRVDG